MNKIVQSHRIITLIVDHLQFVSFGTGKVHIHDSKNVFPGTAPHRTLCGRALYSSSITVPRFSMSTRQVCKSCTASLNPTQAKMESEGMA